MHRCLGIGSTGATDFCRTRPIRCFFEVSSIFVLWTEEVSGRCPETREGRNHRRGGPSGLATHIFSLSSLESKSLRMVILTIILDPLIALSFDHQNHSKWHKWCHVRYSTVPQPLVYAVRTRRTIYDSGIQSEMTEFHPFRLGPK